MSGWQYASSRGRFYPEKQAQARRLEHDAERFQTVEVNNAFYRLPEASTFAAWAERTPPGFVVGVKASGYLTHIKRLAEPAEPVQRFLEQAMHLGTRLGPVLLQLPPNLAADLDRLGAALARFPRDVRVAVEFRHPSWFTDETRAVLERHGASLLPGRQPAPADAAVAHDVVGLRPVPRGARHAAPVLRPPSVEHLGATYPVCGRAKTTSTPTSTTTRWAVRCGMPPCSPGRASGPAWCRPGSRR